MNITYKKQTDSYDVEFISHYGIKENLTVSIAENEDILKESIELKTKLDELERYQLINKAKNDSLFYVSYCKFNQQWYKDLQGKITENIIPYASLIKLTEYDLLLVHFAQELSQIHQN